MGQTWTTVVLLYVGGKGKETKVDRSRQNAYPSTNGQAASVPGKRGRLQRQEGQASVKHCKPRERIHGKEPLLGNPQPRESSKVKSGSATRFPEVSKSAW